MPNWNSLARCCGGAGCLNIGGIPTKTQWVSPGFTTEMSRSNEWMIWGYLHGLDTSMDCAMNEGDDFVTSGFCQRVLLCRLTNITWRYEASSRISQPHWIYTVSNAEDFELTDRIDSSGEQSPSVKSRVADNHRERKAHIHWADPEQTWFTITANQSLSLLLPMLILVSVLVSADPQFVLAIYLFCWIKNMGD